jgi:hypothetical protein
LLRSITLNDTNTIGKTPLNEGSARRRDPYLTTHNTHQRETSMPPARFEPANPASELSQTYTLNRVVRGIGTSRAPHPYDEQVPLNTLAVFTTKLYFIVFHSCTSFLPASNTSHDHLRCQIPGKEEQTSNLPPQRWSSLYMCRRLF